jgi:hypothetical protein
MCRQNGYFYSWTTVSGNPVIDRPLAGAAGWAQANNSKITVNNNNANYEFFPGIYPAEIDISNGTAYFNPGVYTIEGGLKITGGSTCVFGAPVCDRLPTPIIPSYSTDCSSSSFSSVPSGTWYYYCSPWGSWDSYWTTNLLSGAPAVLKNNPAPTFTDGTTPLNGVTFYVTGGATMDLTGTQGSGGNYLAFPNPCPGLGTQGGGLSVPFPDGAADGLYQYAASSLGSLLSLTASPLNYPNADLSPQEEKKCQPYSATRNVWTGEMNPVPGQHLHFLIWAREHASTLTLNGGYRNNWWGIVYNPGDDNANPPVGCGSACLLKINGNGGASGGPPMLTGQIVADNLKFSGNSTVEVYYRPGAGTEGAGTSLVE